MHYVQVSVGGASWQRRCSEGRDRCFVDAQHEGPLAVPSAGMLYAPSCIR